MPYSITMQYPVIMVNILYFLNVSIGFWIVGLIQRTFWLIDPYWTLLPPLIVFFYALHPLAHAADLRSVAADVLMGVWAVRLTINYFRREEWKFGQREDWRCGLCVGGGVYPICVALIDCKLLAVDRQPPNLWIAERSSYQKMKNREAVGWRVKKPTTTWPKDNGTTPGNNLSCTFLCAKARCAPVLMRLCSKKKRSRGFCIYESAYQL